MKKRELFFILIALFAVLITASVFLLKNDKNILQEKKAEETKPVEISTYTPQLHWQANAKQMYELSIDTRLDFSFTDDSHSTLIQKIEGILNFRVFTTNRNGVGVGFQLSPINYIASARKQPQVEKALSSFFTARFDKNGKLEKLFFPGTLFEQENAVLSEIIRALQVVIPNAGNRTWTLKRNTRPAYIRRNTWSTSLKRT